MSSADFLLDMSRSERIGLEEAVLAAGKTVAQISDILDAAGGKQAGLLITRLDPDKHDALPARHRTRLDYDPLSRTAIFLQPHMTRAGPHVALLAAGTSDLPVSREAAHTLKYYGQSYREFTDVGVAGLWRLLDRVAEIRTAPVIIAVAGMDAALASVVGGLVPGAVIAVPTSVGYGVAVGGNTALNAMLASCAPGVTVVNIDNGYGAACAALRVLNAIDRQCAERSGRKSDSD